MNQDQVTGIIRHIGTLLGGYLLSKGKLDADTLQVIVGAIAALGGVGWSFVSKMPAQIPLPAPIPPVVPPGPTPLRPS